MHQENSKSLIQWRAAIGKISMWTCHINFVRSFWGVFLIPTKMFLNFRRLFLWWSLMALTSSQSLLSIHNWSKFFYKYSVQCCSWNFSNCCNFHDKSSELTINDFISEMFLGVTNLTLPMLKEFFWFKYK